jgi:hydrogenase maturation protease
MDAPRILVAGIGNIFLGDDGFGVEVAQRLLLRPRPAGVEVVDVGIRGVHLVHELMDGYDVLVLVDAVRRGLDPGTVGLLELDPAPDVPPGAVALEAHGLDPASVLAQARLLGAAPRRTLLVACEPASLDDGIGLTPVVAEAVAPAVDAVLGLLGELTSEPVAAGAAGEGT